MDKFLDWSYYRSNQQYYFNNFDMSYDVGVIIKKNKNKVNLVDVNLSTGSMELLGTYENADKALEALQKNIKRMNKIGFEYEGVFVEGFEK